MNYWNAKGQLFFILIFRFNIEGFVTGFGNPDWSRTHEPATGTCPVVAALVDGGATCVGKTFVDDMALGFVHLPCSS